LRSRTVHHNVVQKFFKALVCVLFLMTAVPFTQAQSFSGQDRDRVRGMLDIIKGDIKKNYYDPAFHGIDIEARFKAADEKIKSVDSLGQAYGVIAQALSEFNDSHLFFRGRQRCRKSGSRTG
jgi:hypothetical protein